MNSMLGLEREYRTALNNFGLTAQEHKLNEEMDELMDAITHCALGGDVEELEAELADCINVAMQFVLYYGGSAESVLSHCTSKMQRTIKRIRENYYEK